MSQTAPPQLTGGPSRPSECRKLSSGAIRTVLCEFDGSALAQGQHGHSPPVWWWFRPNSTDGRATRASSRALVVAITLRRDTHLPPFLNRAGARAPSCRTRRHSLRRRFSRPWPPAPRPGPPPQPVGRSRLSRPRPDPMAVDAAAAVSSPRATAAAVTAAAAAAGAAAVVSSPRRLSGGSFQHQRRWPPAAVAPSYRACLVVVWVLGFALVFLWQSTSVGPVRLYTRPPMPLPKRPAASMGQWVASPPVYDLREFGALGDGRTVNTAAFEAAVAAIAERGGGRLTVPAGRWLTAPFNLTSRMTLFLASGAEILGVQDERYWPLMSPLPSYGYGREHKGPRYGSLIHGQNLKDVTITGHNGTINGQGQSWWIKFRMKLLNHTRGPLVQLMQSSNIIISNITLQNSPFWTLHTYDCKNITISETTILAPTIGAPNTDGIDPDSCENVIIKNCYISVGDDGIAIKSGWDQYGIAYGRPSSNITIQNVIIRSMVSAGVSIGSEMSGGVSNILVENVHIWNSRRGVRIKTAPGRGAYVSNIVYRNITLDKVRVGIVIKTDYNEHPDEGFDPKAVPIIGNISYTSIHGHGVRVPVRIQGSAEIPVTNVTFHDMSVGIVDKKFHVFQCAFVQGQVIGSVFPMPCKNLDLYNERHELVKQSTLQNISDIDYSF